MTLLDSTSELVVHATVGPHGRIVVPAPIRKEFGWAEGTVLTFKVHEGQIVLSDQRAALRQYQEYAQTLIPAGTDVLADFLGERRSEAKREQDDAGH